MADYKNDSFRKFYEIDDDFIGSGDFADIYNGKNKQTNESVAIKLAGTDRIRDYLINHNIPKENLKQFINILNNEVKYMKILQKEKETANDNVVKIKDCFYDNKEFAIIMELCDTNLYNHVLDKGKGLNSKEIYYILSQLNTSFEIMNKNGILHRALRIENILIKYKDEVKDQFIAKLKLTDDCCSLEDSYNLLSYKIFENRRIYALEVLNEGEYTKESDLWSLGILIYLLYFGEYPFLGENKEEVIKAINKHKLERLNGKDNPDLFDLINKLLVLEPKKRISWEEYFEHPFFRKKQNYKKYYKKGDMIGKGGFGVVYKGEDLITHEKKAIKIMSKTRVKEFIKKNQSGVFNVTE